MRQAITLCPTRLGNPSEKGWVLERKGNLSELLIHLPNSLMLSPYRNPNTPTVPAPHPEPVEGEPGLLATK